jgi:membrane protein
MFELSKATFRNFMRDECPRMAAALSYYTVISLPALLILLVVIAGTVLEPEAVQGRLMQEIRGALGSEGAAQIQTMLESAERPGSGGGITTLLTVGALVFGATGAFVQLQHALNTAWNVKRDPEAGALLGLVLKRLLSFGMILVIAFLLLVSMVLSALLSAAGGLVAARLPGEVGAVALWVMELGLSLLVITGLFTAIYKILPDAHVSWSDVWRGALVTAALFVAGKSLLGVYISRSDPGSAYGAAGSLAVVLIWIYYSSMIALLGAEFTQAYAVRRGSGIEPDGDAVAADA